MSLVEIKKPPPPERAAILLHPSDDVAVARVGLAAGQRVVVAGYDVVLRESVPAGHKIALREIAAGSCLRRYGQVIGRAPRRIDPGEHVHTHNLTYEEGSRAYEFPARESEFPAPAAGGPVFQGYLREDGRAGTRNYIAVMAASNCASHAAEEAARGYVGKALPPGVDGVVAFPHGEGCGHSIGPDTEQLRRTLWGVMDHPNVSAAVLIGLGCEVNQIDQYQGSRVAGLTLQDSGGTRAAVEAAQRIIDQMLERAASEKRVEMPAARICLGLNCGGSDSFSGITANPALGFCSDLLAKLGGTSVLAETPEIFGAEHLLVARARSRAVGERLLDMVRGYKEYLNRFGGSFDDNPSPGNKEGGLSNIVEKSLGAVAKGGSSLLNEVLDYGERIHGPGLAFMNTPGYDPVSLTGLAAGGVNLIAFTTGRGSAIGFPIVPVLKIASNTAMYRRLKENMDLNAGRIADGEADVAEMGGEILDMLVRVASGERTRSEVHGHREFVPWRIGPVM